MALTQEQFFWKTIDYFLGSTGIPVNFGITITLGFIVGAAIAGQTFYLFTIENLRQFGGAQGDGLSAICGFIGMILLQGAGRGPRRLRRRHRAGGARFLNRRPHHAPGRPAYPLAGAVGVGVAVLMIVMLTSLVSIRKVLVLEPAVVFRG